MIRHYHLKRYEMINNDLEKFESIIELLPLEPLSFLGNIYYLVLHQQYANALQ